jgi:hypothetical protein
MMRKVETEEIRHENGFEYTNGTDDSGYRWFEMTVLTHWDADGSSKVLLLAALAQRRVPLDFRDPFALHAELWDQIIILYDISVWRMRDPVRELEKVRTSWLPYRSHTSSLLTGDQVRYAVTRHVCSYTWVHTPRHPRIGGS